MDIDIVLMMSMSIITEMYDREAWRFTYVLISVIMADGHEKKLKSLNDLQHFTKAVLPNANRLTPGLPNTKQVQTLKLLTCSGCEVVSLTMSRLGWEMKQMSLINRQYTKNTCH